MMSPVDTNETYLSVPFVKRRDVIVKILLSDFKRLLLNPKTYLASIGVTVALFFSEQDYFSQNSAENAISRYLEATEMSGFLIAFIFCALPFATVFCEDIQDRFIRQSCLRTGIKKYVCSKILVIYLSSVVTMVAGSILFYVLHSLSAQEAFYETEIYGNSYMGFLFVGGHYFLYCLATALHLGMLAGSLSVMAAFTSLYIRSKTATLAMPVFFYQILMEFDRNTLFGLLFTPSSRVFVAGWKNVVAVICMSLIPVILLLCGSIRKIMKVL